MEIIAAQCSKAYRERLYPPLTTLRLFIEQVLSEDAVCQEDVIRYLLERTAEGVPANGLNTGGLLPGPAALAAGGAGEPISEDRASPGSEDAQNLDVAWSTHQVVRWHDRIDAGYGGESGGFSVKWATERGRVPIGRLGGLIRLSSGAVIGHAVCACKGKGDWRTKLVRQLMPLAHAGRHAAGGGLVGHLVGHCRCSRRGCRYPHAAAWLLNH